MLIDGFGGTANQEGSYDAAESRRDQGYGPGNEINA